MPNPPLRIITMIRKVNHSFEIWQCMYLLVNLRQYVIIIAYGIIIFIHRRVFSRKIRIGVAIPINTVASHQVNNNQCIFTALMWNLREQNIIIVVCANAYT